MLGSDPSPARRAGSILLRLGAVLSFLALDTHLFHKDPVLVRNVSVTVLAAVAAGCLLTAFGRKAIGRSWLLAGLVSVMLTELTVGGPVAGFASRYEPSRMRVVDALTSTPDLVAFLKAQPGPFRVNANENDVPYNFGDWHGIETTSGGYVASMLANVYDSSPHELAMQRLAGERYYLAKAPARPDQRLVFEDPGGLKLFENPNVYPRAWSVHDTFVARSRREVVEFILNKKDLLATTAPIQGARLSLEQCAGAADRVRVVEHRPGRTVLDVDLGRRGLVAVSDVHFPGWQARVDRPGRFHPPPPSGLTGSPASPANACPAGCARTWRSPPRLRARPRWPGLWRMAGTPPARRRAWFATPACRSRARRRPASAPAPRPAW